MLLRNKTVLAIGGMDPAGAAGVLADARMLQSTGAHSAALITGHTAQGRTRHVASRATAVDVLRQQWRSLRYDMPIDGVKIGAVFNLAQAQWLHEALPTLNVPIVFDPVLASSSGGALGQTQAARWLMPVVTLATPNRQEVEQLYGKNWAEQLPCEALVTGSDTGINTSPIQHQLISRHSPRSWQVARRPGQYRGTGCLLASAITAYLVAGYATDQACDQALAQVDAWLAQAWRFADGVHLPRPPA